MADKLMKHFVACFHFDWRSVTEGLMKPQAIVVHLDVIGNYAPRLVTGSEHSLVRNLVLET